MADNHLELGQGDMPGIGLPRRRAMGAEDVSQLQLRPGHARRRSLQTSLDGPILQLRLHFVEADRVADRFGSNVSIHMSRNRPKGESRL